MAYQTGRALPTWSDEKKLRGAANKEEWETRVEQQLKMARLWEVVAKGVQGADDSIAAVSSMPAGRSTSSASTTGTSARRAADPQEDVYQDAAASDDGSDPPGTEDDITADGRLHRTLENIIADETAHAFIGSTLDTTLLPFYRKTKTAKGLWDALQRRFALTAAVFKVQLRKEMSSLVMSKGENITEYINRATGMRDRHAAAGVHIEDEDFVHTVLGGRPDSFNNVADVLTSELNCPNMDRVQHVLASAEVRLIQRDLVTVGPVQARAFAAVNGRSARHSQRRCYHCGTLGHLQRDCPALRQQDKTVQESKKPARAHMCVASQRATEFTF